MVSYEYNAPTGVPGDITRADNSKVEPIFLVSPYPSNYGVPVKYAQGPGSPGQVGTGATPFAGSETAASFAGILARAVPGISGSSVNEQVDTFQPNPNEPQGMLIEGYMNVVCNAGTPQRGQPVYVVVTASSGHPVGAFETTANGGNNIALTGTPVGNVTWAADGMDSFGNCEVRVGF
jgi:hypothetical protein